MISCENSLLIKPANKNVNAVNVNERRKPILINNFILFGNLFTAPLRSIM
jgi:hypothetical protein